MEMSEQEILDLIKAAENDDQEAIARLDALTDDEIRSYHCSVIYELSKYYMAKKPGAALKWFKELYLDLGDEEIKELALVEFSTLVLLAFPELDGGETAKVCYDALVSRAFEGMGPAQIALAVLIENRSNVKIVGDDDTEAFYWYKKVLIKQPEVELHAENAARAKAKAEKQVLSWLEQAEAGDENAHKRLANLIEEPTLDFSLSTVMLLMEHYCMNRDTHRKAGSVAYLNQGRTDELVDTLPGECSASRWMDAFGLSCAIWSTDLTLNEWEEPKLEKAWINLYVLAKNGYAPAQYWQAFLAEHQRGYLLARSTFECLYYYKRAASQGIRGAQAAFERCAKQWNLCQHCGGAFKGLFVKKCSLCGHPKDY